MTHSQLLQPLRPLYNIMNSTLDQAQLFGLNNHDISFSITTSEASLSNTADSCFSALINEEFVEFPYLDDDMHVMLPNKSIDHSIDGFQSILNDEIEDVCRWFDENENKDDDVSSYLTMEENEISSPDHSTVSNDASVCLPSINESIILPTNDMEIDVQISLPHLLEAFAEGKDKKLPQLAEVIRGSIMEKVSPVGEALERVTYSLFHPMENQRDYINQESRKNFEAAFRAFYEIFPYGRFPHFAANAAILEAMPKAAETIHIIDFDMGEGIQWPPVIEALAYQQKVLRLTSVKLADDTSCNDLIWNFEETKWRLHEYARSFGLKLMVEEMRLEDLVNNLEKSNEKEWMAFNCTTNLPHMGRMRNRRDIMEFLKVAQVVLANSAAYNKGILTYGHGEDGERMKHCSGYSSFFNENLRHYLALYESMECSFPSYLAEARLAMESLFLTPYVSSLSCFQRWEEIRDGAVMEEGVGLESLILSEANLIEASTMVNQGESLYTINVDEQKQNEMILEWRGTPLVRVSTWM